MSASLKDFKTFCILMSRSFCPKSCSRKVFPLLIPDLAGKDFLFLLSGKISMKIFFCIRQHVLTHIRQIADKTGSIISGQPQLVKHQVIDGGIRKSGKQLWFCFYQSCKFRILHKIRKKAVSIVSSYGADNTFNRVIPEGFF